MSNPQSFSYFAPAGLSQRWQLHDSGCKRIDVPGSCLQTSKAPPPLKAAPAAQSAAARPTKPQPAQAGPQGKEPFKMLLDVGRTVEYLTTPPPPKPAPIAKPASAPARSLQAAAAEPVKPIFKFDIQDIPATMQRMGWVKSAELMQQFFAGRLNYSRSTSDESNAIDQHGHFYASEFVDTKRFTWKWLLEYKAVEQALAQLIQSGFIASKKLNVKNQSAYSTLGNKIIASVNQKYRTFIGQIDTLAECNGDVFALHRGFQFQLNKIGMLSYLNTDLGGSLGNFAIYAAVAFANVKRDDFKGDSVAVTHVYIYAKDNYSFNDDEGYPSQYLGHWNKKGVIFVPTPAVIQLVKGVMGNFGKYLPEINRTEFLDNPANPWFQGADFTVQLGDKYQEDSIYHPVRNSHFHEWQMQHQRGGNVLSFSDLKLVRLENPITFSIPTQR